MVYLFRPDYYTQQLNSFCTERPYSNDIYIFYSFSTYAKRYITQL